MNDAPPPGSKDAAPPPEGSLSGRLAALDWSQLRAELAASGHAVTPPLLEPDACRRLIDLWDRKERFRATVDMEQHRFGRGHYRYFAEPLPREVGVLRRVLYARLAPVANRWEELLASRRSYPESLARFRAECAAAGQRRPTPLLLRYEEDGYNCLHQDRYGEVAFPMQVAVLLSEPGRDFTGGEFLLVEQRPRVQSRAEVVPLRRGQAVIFPNAERPVSGARGIYRVATRHGVSRLRRGRRFTLGIIFHDAR